MTASQLSTHLGEVEQQGFDRRQHLHAALYDLAPSVSKGDVMDAGHLEAQFRQQLVRYLLLRRNVREVGVGILGLKGMIWEVFEFFRDDPLDLGVVLYRRMSGSSQNSWIGSVIWDGWPTSSVVFG